MDDFEPGPADAWDDEYDAELTAGTTVFCPYCGEPVELALDQSGGAIQEYVEDCEVCSQPLSVRVAFDGDGTPSVAVSTLDEW
jgi:hypothetical protein